MPKQVFVGWDSRQAVTYDVCKYSINKTASLPISIFPLKQQVLRESGAYTRGEDKKASTEFSLTRFYIPLITQYKGLSIFCDSDFLWLEDIQHVFDLAKPEYAVQVVKHHYNPTAHTKMDGKLQEVYPKKNWSSLILWNNEHPKNKSLSHEFLNSAEPSTLHQFKWLDDHEIGEISFEWNWLVGWYKEPDDGKPKAIHYTEGGPWLENCKSVEYADLWEESLKEYLAYV